MGRSGCWESLRDVRVRSVFVRGKAGWGMVGQIGQTLQVMSKIHAGFFNADWCGESLDLAFLSPPSSNGLAIFTLAPERKFYGCSLGVFVFTAIRSLFA